jgi:hypothetical protein
MTVAITAACAMRLPRRGHVPPHGIERDEWDPGAVVLAPAPSS